MGRPKGSKNRPKTPSFDLFSSGGLLTLDQDEIVQQNVEIKEEIKQTERLEQEANELDEMNYMLEMSARKPKKVVEQSTYVSTRPQVKFVLGEDTITGHHCGVSSDPKTKGLHIIKSLNPHMLSFMPASAFEYVEK